MRNILLVFILFVSCLSFGQQTKVTGRVLDPETKEGLPGVTVKFQLSKIGTTTDSLGFYILESYYATDSLVFFFPEYKVKTVKVKRDVAQTIDVTLEQAISDIETVFVLPPDEFPSTTLHKKVVANKPINNKEKLAAYDYEGYTKIQLDVNNIGDKLAERKVIQPLSLVLNYMDSTEDGKTYLPLLLS
ncbi:MAG: carboxypeptidase-like regulatory domain-containing protein, partial [Fluviicola sp.]